MALFKLLLFSLLLDTIVSVPVEESFVGDEEVMLNRTLRDRDGKYHPEHDHGHRVQHNHVSSVSHSGPEGTSGLIDLNGNVFTFGNPDFGSKVPPNFPVIVPQQQQYQLPAPVPVLPPPPAPSPPSKPMQGPNGYANCGCVVAGQCAPEVVLAMPALLQTLKNDVVCGHRYSLCCPDDPWAGPIDQWADQIPCVAEEECIRKYGDNPYDIQNYGVIGPCLGLGSVRCLDNKPSSIIVPIIDYPPISSPTQPPVVVPPQTQPPTQPPTYVPPETEPPVVYVPPVTEPPVVYVPPVTEPPVVYVPPVTEPPVVYIPPETEPPVVYVPPVTEPPVVYIPPETEPPVVYIPPETEPPVVYAPPETEPPVAYVPPTGTYNYPPAETYVPPVDTYQPPGSNYGVPDLEPVNYPAPRGYYSGGYGFPYGGGYGFGYPGLGFRKRFHFSKGFFG